MQIIEIAGRKIRVESEGPGKGTTFRFMLPVAGEARSPIKVITGK
jgi:signal transduction histidine kinase